MDLKLKIYIVNDQGEKFLGIGVIWLLKAIGEEGSIHQAAAKLGISYTKAFRMLKSLETGLNRQILVRRRGGANRRGAVLTDFGKKIISNYDSFQKQVKKDAEGAFRDFTDSLNTGVKE
ncbi:MAG: LysR family transcriptional regulator [Spirochaetales bacterium]|nr:LysR family transcriptional regulator [Spirochaetales bacterium]